MIWSGSWTYCFPISYHCAPCVEAALSDRFRGRAPLSRRVENETPSQVRAPLGRQGPRGLSASPQHPSAPSAPRDILTPCRSLGLLFRCLDNGLGLAAKNAAFKPVREVDSHQRPDICFARLGRDLIHPADRLVQPAP